MNPIKVLSKKHVYESGPICLQEFSIQQNNQHLTRVLLSLDSDTALTIPVFANGDYLLIKQYRLGIQDPLLEFPNGGINSGETPLQAADRELKEETGALGTTTALGVFYPLAGLVDLRVHVFKTDIQELNQQELEAYEDIELVRLSPQQLKNTELVDGYVLAALQLLNP